MQIFKVCFKRRKDSPWENGIMIEGAAKDLIIDSLGKIVDNPLWNFEREYHYFSIDLSGILDKEIHRK